MTKSSARGVSQSGCTLALWATFGFVALCIDVLAARYRNWNIDLSLSDDTDAVVVFFFFSQAVFPTNGVRV